MALRIVTAEEVAEAIRGGKEIAAAKLHVQTELAALREWLGYRVEQKRLYGRTYPFELLDEIEREIEHSWPDPVTLDDLGKG